MHRVRRLSKRLASLPHCHQGGTLLLWTNVYTSTVATTVPYFTRFGGAEILLALLYEYCTVETSGNIVEA